jgi:hypothetical protein
MTRSGLIFSLALALCAPLQAQIVHSADLIERRMREEPLIVGTVVGSRMAVDRTQRVTLDYPDDQGGPMQIKWAKAPRDGSAFNNEPRYEIAAYEIQRLFLDEGSYVVPPTVGRAVPLGWFRQFDASADATFRGVNSVVLTMQYWLQDSLTPQGFWNEGLFQVDTLYARHFANFNVLTYLIRHSDSNSGNYLVSLVPGSPRVFSVDNGVSFRSETSDRGYEWRDLKVNRLPRATVERLRTVTEEDLRAALGVLLQFEIRDDELVPVTPTTNLGESRGVRRSGSVVQFGLTGPEIRDVFNRLSNLLGRVDSGRITVF